jgi:transcriptional regulator with XRE-family HTH domain
MIRNSNIEIKEEFAKQIGAKSYLDFDKSTVVRRSETIGSNLKYLRKRIGITQKEIADKIGIAQQTYAGYENGKHEPSIELMIRLADVYEVSMDYITGRFWGTCPNSALHEKAEAEEALQETIMLYRIQREEERRLMALFKSAGANV